MRMLVAAGCLVILASPFAHATPGRNNKKREEKLAAKIAREKNPGKAAKLRMKLAKLKLSEANEAYRQQNFEEGKALLQQYLEQVKASWATLQGAPKAVKKHLGAFMKLEMSLSRDGRFLEDMREGIPYPHSEFVKEIEKESNTVHTQVMEALFPSGYMRKRRVGGSGPTHSKVPVAAKAGAAKS